jgi:PAS domain S-box-containing protein
MSTTGSLPLIAGDFFLEHYHKLCQELNGKHLEEVFARFANNYSWTIPIEAAAEDYNDYQAIIISDCNYKVIWVDGGFTDMTGYNPYEIIGNRPTMLHGPGTKDEERAQFHAGIATNEPFTAAITNYRKNGEAYLCKVKIVPLYNKEKKLTHYIAFEREVA